MRAAIVIALFACGSGRKQAEPAAPAEVARLGKLADEMLVTARAADVKRTAALEDAMKSLGPRGDLGPCPIKVPIVGTEDMGKLGQQEPAGNDPNWRSIRAEQMMVVERAKLATTDSVRKKHVEEMIDFTRQGLNATNSAATEKWLRYYGDLANDAWEMVIIAARRVEPAMLKQGEYSSGSVLGTAFVYSYPDNKIVCAADVDAHSSRLLRDAKSVQDFALGFDLDNEAFRAAAPKLVAAGPLK
jgi:hypothetical protein